MSQAHRALRTWDDHAVDPVVRAGLHASPRASAATAAAGLCEAGARPCGEAGASQVRSTVLLRWVQGLRSGLRVGAKTGLASGHTMKPEQDSGAGSEMGARVRLLGGLRAESGTVDMVPA